jgi:hypothetical protein
MHLNITIPSDENYNAVEAYLQRLERVNKLNWDITHWKSLIAPNTYDIIINGVTPAQAEEIKKEFRSIMKNTLYKNVCRFEVGE